MGATPEGRVKLAIRRGLDKLGRDCVYCMPVPYGYGSRAVDFIGCFKGRYFAVEAKRPDFYGNAVATRIQQNFLDRVADAGGIALVARAWEDVELAFACAGLLKDDRPQIISDLRAPDASG